MADKAELSTADYEDLASGTKLFTADEALAAFQPGDTVTSLEYTAGLINPFLVESGLTKKQASLDGPVRTAVHRGLRRPPIAVGRDDDGAATAADGRPRPVRRTPRDGAVGSTRSSVCGARSR